VALVENENTAFGDESDETTLSPILRGGNMKRKKCRESWTLSIMLAHLQGSSSGPPILSHVDSKRSGSYRLPDHSGKGPLLVKESVIIMSRRIETELIVY
jgi:hypothetical protein